MVDTLQDAKHEDIFWTIRQIVKRRDLIVRAMWWTRTSSTASFPTVTHLTGNFLPWLIQECLMFLGELPVTGVYMEHNTGRNISDNKACASGTKNTAHSWDYIHDWKDGDTRKDYQPERDFIVRNIVKDIRHNKELIAEIDDELRKLIPLTGYKLHTMPGIDLVTEAQIISEIGDINRFPDSDKLARFMGLAPVQFSSAGKGKDQRCRNGNRH